MKLLDRLNRKFGRFAISNLMLYIVIGKAAVYIAGFFNMSISSYLMLDPILVKQGQVWRLLTFLIVPNYVSFTDIFWLAISLYFNYFIGRMLEREWGAFRFNIYYLIGVICTIAFSMIFNVPGSTFFLDESLFLGFATLYPNIQVLLFFFLPIKVKWMGFVVGGLLLFQFLSGGWATKLMIFAGLLNYILFFAPDLIARIRSGIRRERFEERSRPGGRSGVYRKTGENGKIITDVTFHRCVVCGRTEKDVPDMQFRYCAQCDGNKEYCMDHLYNHVHYRDPSLHPDGAQPGEGWTPPQGK